MNRSTQEHYSPPVYPRKSHMFTIVRDQWFVSGPQVYSESIERLFRTFLDTPSVHEYLMRLAAFLEDRGDLNGLRPYDLRFECASDTNAPNLVYFYDVGRHDPPIITDRMCIALVLYAKGNDHVKALTTYGREGFPVPDWAGKATEVKT